MTNLDQLEYQNILDKQGMLRHIQELPDQIEQAWADMKKFVVPANYIKVHNVLILGMGGSGVSGLLTRTLGWSTSKVPIVVLNDYNLPGYVSDTSLVIAVSYSGNTEETVAAFREAGKRRAKLVAITMGGEIGSIASQFKAPVYKINYGSQPRAALGYTYLPVLALLSKLGIIEIGNDDVEESILLMKGLRAKLNPDVPSYQNDAKKLALTMQDRLPVMVGAGMMAPVAYRWVTQINENSKHLATSLSMPELCHNFVVGLQFPAPIIKQLYVVILQSKKDHERNRLRQNILMQILQKKSIKYEVIMVHPSGSMLSEQLLTVYLGDYVSYYLAILGDVNPTNVEEIDFIRKQLGK